MDSALIDFLRKDYPSHFGVEWDENTMQIRKEQRSKGKFEIRDGQPHIVQYAGRGVSVINNNSDIAVEIIDFEHYINLFRDTDAKPNRIMSQSLKAFRKPQKIFSNIRAHEPLVHDFIFEQRIYSQEYKIC